MEGIVQQEQSNVLYQPEIYQNINQDMEDHMAETQSISTVGAGTVNTNYHRDIDPTLLKAQQMYILLILI